MCLRDSAHIGRKVLVVDAVVIVHVEGFNAVAQLHHGVFHVLAQ